MLTQACSCCPIVCQWTACVLSKGVVTRDFTTVCAGLLCSRAGHTKMCGIV